MLPALGTLLLSIQVLPLTGALALPRADHLEAARATFAAADLDGDGRLDAAEIRSARIPPREAAAHDADADGRLSLDEFLVYYRRLLLNAGRPVDRSLEREVHRVLDERRARAQRREEERREDLRQRSGPGGVPPGPAVARERIESARRVLADRPARASPGDTPQGLPSTPDAGDGALARAQERLARAQGLLGERAERIAALRRELAPGAEPGALAGAAGDEPPPPRGPAADPAPGQGPSTRSTQATQASQATQPGPRPGPGTARPHGAGRPTAEVEGSSPSAELTPGSGAEAGVEGIEPGDRRAPRR